MAPAVRIKDSHVEQRAFQRRMAWAGVLVVLSVGMLGARLSLLQIVRHDYYLELSQGNRARIEPIPANRGLILDRAGKVLAENQPAYQLELVREQVKDLDATLRALAELELIDVAELPEIRRLVRSRRGFEGVPIRLRMSEEEIARFAVNRHRFPGVDIRTRLTRFYPHGELGVHALGYVGAISEQDVKRIDAASYAGTSLIGKLGVESARETELHGTNGFREILVNAQGRSVQRLGSLEPELRSRAPRAGADVMLSLDLAAQKAAEDGLLGRRGAVVAIDPSNGNVLVMASRPGFDPGIFGRGVTRPEYRELSESIDRPLLNRAIRGTYPPGSTVKPVIAMAGLSYGVIHEHETRYCPGVYRLPNSRRIAREGRGGTHGWVDIEAAIGRSCDVYFYALSNELGVDRLHEFMDPFGYGKPTGIDIAGESTGILPSKEWKKKVFKRPEDQVWFPGETINFGIGQGYMTVTPIQLAQVTAVLAAKGKVFKPRLVTGLRDSETGRVEAVAPEPQPSVKGGTPEEWQTVFNGMVKTMTIGTARGITRDVAYTIAGKTGTAQVFSVGQNERYVEKNVAERLRDHSWFTAFAPAEDPKIAVAVLVENGGFGASAAAPIARKVMDAYLLPMLQAPGDTKPIETKIVDTSGDEPVEPEGDHIHLDAKDAL
ncbi:MAG: penicillin-binding protein 2 [Steroidobacteraceae bacterium]